MGSIRHTSTFVTVGLSGRNPRTRRDPRRRQWNNVGIRNMYDMQHISSRWLWKWVSQLENETGQKSKFRLHILKRWDKDTVNLPVQRNEHVSGVQSLAALNIATRDLLPEPYYLIQPNHLVARIEGIAKRAELCASVLPCFQRLFVCHVQSMHLQSWFVTAICWCTTNF